MKAFGLILSAVALVLIAGGAIALALGASSGDDAQTHTPTVQSIAESTSGNLESPAATTNPILATPDVAAETPEPQGTSDGAGSMPTPTPAVTDVSVKQPSMELATFPLASVEATYTESHQFGSITVRFRPGAYSEAYAAEIALLTEESIAEANAKLQQQWSGDLTIFLADQLFAEDCLGCQGFTESDFRWIFMLDDGSVVPDEFEALLVHEVTHLISGNTIHLPFDIFYVEGLATWVMTDDLIKHGYLSPLQSTAWIYEAGALPSLKEIMDDDFAGRMRKRVYYDAAAAFAFYVIETYGWEEYLSLYRQNPIETVLGKPLAEVEAGWHQYLDQYTGVTVNGTGAVEWWNAASHVIDAYSRFYVDPSAYTADQYRLLTLSRLALNRADAGNALAFLSQSGV